MRKVLAALIPPMLAMAHEQAQFQAETVIAEATARADSMLSHEISRLEALARINPAVRDEEIAFLKLEHQALLAALPGARVRLDSLRLVVSADFLSLRR